MDLITRFGVGLNEYRFETANQVSITDNFRDVVPRESKIPGVDGSFNEYGAGPIAREKGNVQLTFWLFGETPEAIWEQRVALGKLAALGTQRLYKVPYADGEGELYCDAYINNISMPQNARDLAHKRQRVTINFGVSDPSWKRIGTESPLWGGGESWGGGAKWGGNPLVYHFTASDNLISVEPGGNGIISPRINLIVPVGQSATNIRVQRFEGGLALDEVRWAGTLNSGDNLEINCRAYSVDLNGADAYGANYSFTTAAWMRLIGRQANTLRILMNAGGEVELRIRYYEVFI